MSSAALRRAAAFGVGASGHRKVRGPGDALRFLHDQIAITVLPRQLEFFRDGAPWLTCTAAARRLSGYRTEAGETGFPSTPDEATARQALDAVKDFVARTCPTGSVISVRSMPPDPPPAPGQGGVPVDWIAAAFGLTRGQPASASLLETFATTAGDVVTAAALLEGELLFPLAGEDAQIDGLTMLLEALLPQLDALPRFPQDSAAGPRLVLLAAAEHGEPVIAAATNADRTLLVTGTPGSAGALLRHWQALIG
ncbi:hypothetical protein [Tropicibacter sp. S64]|uniref:hypothetical protein n=1 Tax=Tropicibacter sp. S64 TaxID=3415122 RepID=UPI003C7E117B